MKVLVTDGDNRAALAVTRALGRRGHAVVVAEKRTPSLAQTSRFCADRVLYADPVHDDVAFVKGLADAVAERGIDVVLPVADITTNLVTTHRGLFEPRCMVPFADAGTIARAADKVDMVQTATRLGVATPRSWVVSGPEDAIEADVPYPVVLKPHRSRVRTATAWESCSVSYSRTPEDLRESLRARKPHEFPLMLQERIVGPGIGIFVCYDRGKLVAVFSHKRLREKPPWGGVSVLCESTPTCPNARDYTERLMHELNWHGVAMVEFKRDVRDGLPKLMEINGRFWGSLQLGIDAGVDFPNILLDTIRGAENASPPPYRVGVKSRWLWGDFDSLLLRLRARKTDWPAQDGRGRLGAIAQFMRFVGKELYYDNPKPDDLAPWFFETRSRFRRGR
jgi:predicted ATP-grasp superfamily ATP-dependent carboligase